MHSSTIDIATPDGVAAAYLTRPDGNGDHPAVLLIMDAFGLRPTLREIAGRIAQRGYVVLAPNVFYRAGRAPVLPLPDLTDPEQRASFFAALQPLMAQLAPESAAADGAAYLDLLADVAPGPVAITGYCMGARVGLRIAVAHPERVVAFGGFHAGRLVTDAPDSPHRTLCNLRAEVYFGHADQDPSMSVEQIAVLDGALEEAGVATPHRDLRGRAARVHDGRHRGLRRGRP